ncbi:Disease resistance protein [Corchorus olitorius]|uniref:Disease resistance protein n=1 Tax=Corchorus olitorius TaxID=93759 RepID=A0A1R3HV55_9ROSI|nr:Disease resistance protein [Corchorus olitorius]
MAGFVESAGSNSVGTLLVDWVAKPAKSQLDYVRHFHENVQKLEEKRKEVLEARDRLQHEIEETERQLQLIEAGVRSCQSKAEEILTQAESMEKRIAENKRCFNWCPNWWWRYRLSKKLEKKTLPEIDQILDKIAKFGQSGKVGYRDASTVPTIEFLSSKDFWASKSSKAAADQMIEALKDEKVSRIALRGMGGVGKTTLVREVGIQAKKLDLFDKVVTATVSKNPNFETIQDEIAKYLDFSMDDRGKRRSKQEFCLRLQKEKRILIILDDVWSKIKLKEDIGIPESDQDHKGCKILFTTRRHQVVQLMDCQKEVELGCLDVEDAWELFQMKAGLRNCNDDAIKKVAAEVIKKCQGLPVSIIALGAALKGKSLAQWEATCRRLKSRRLMDIEDIDDDENTYLCLEQSFDYLKDMPTKKCLLLCSLFPEDYKINVEELVRYARGLEIFKGIHSIEEVRIEVFAAVDNLKDSCLLLDCGKSRVKMHDTVRDVALWISSNRKDLDFVIKPGAVETWPKDESLESCTAIYYKTSPIANLPEGLVCPNLKILLLGRNNYFDPTRTPSAFLEGMRALQLSDLYITDCEGLEQIIEKDVEPSSQDHYLQPICFPNLTHILIWRCANLKSLFSVSVARRGLPKLKRLVVYDMSELEQVFERGDVSMADGDEVLIQLPQLEEDEDGMEGQYATAQVKTWAIGGHIRWRWHY